MAHFRKITIGVGVVLALGLGMGAWRVHDLLNRSLPVRSGVVTLAGLSREASAQFDQLGVPTIRASNYTEVSRCLGYIMAGDRFFQMDVLRRNSAGRLAELFGLNAVDQDVSSRVFGLPGVADRFLSELPALQRDYLRAFAMGVNQSLDEMKALPPEYYLLGTKPEKWSERDCVLVFVSQLSQTILSASLAERSVSVMERELPATVTRFLTPDSDEFTDRLVGDNSWRRPSEVPIDELRVLARKWKENGSPKIASLDLARIVPAFGSNCWAVTGSKTKDGRAILANDMHLPLGLPNIWYRANLIVPQGQLSGILVPGMPMVVSGTNAAVAWGLTSLHSDNVDLVLLEQNPENPEQYRSKGEWLQFAERVETIKIKGKADKTFSVKDTIWGPVAQDLLNGSHYAFKWTGHEAGSLNLELLSMLTVKSVDEALEVARRFGGPPLNVIAADKDGNIGWTCSGRLPLRRGGDGTIARSWSDGKVGWDRLLSPDELPHVTNPSSGFLVNANNRPVGTDFSHQIGSNFPLGYRGFRIQEMLTGLTGATEETLATQQMDIRCDFYAFYRDLALKTLDAVANPDEELQSIRRFVGDWKGEANLESVGFSLLVMFQEILSEDVWRGYLDSCYKKDKNFSYVYRWFNIEAPLRKMLGLESPDLIPPQSGATTWNEYRVSVLRQAIGRLRQYSGQSRVQDQRWGAVHINTINHLLGVSSILGVWLNLEPMPMPGCPDTVRYSGPDSGVSERFVISPGHPEDGLFQMPGGQSGHFLSPHYADQYAYWQKGAPLKFIQPPNTQLDFKPKS